MIQVADFKRDRSFYKKLDLVLTVKSFDLQAIRKRYLASKQNKSGRSGSVERRELAKGGIVTCSLEKGAFSVNDNFKGIPEPRGIAASENFFAFSAEKEVFVIDTRGGYKKLTHPWFSYIHTVDFNHDQTKVVVSSSGFDLIQEWSLESETLTCEWLAWENGFNEALDPLSKEPIFLTRDRSKTNVEGYHVISDPENEVLPTAMRAAFINSVTYENEDEVLATFFHEGAVFRVNLKSGKSTRVISGMKNPHGGRVYASGYLATSTGTGRLHRVLASGDEEIYSLTALPGKPPELGEMEWVQNAITHEGCIIAIDSNRTAFVIFHPEKKLYDIIPYDPDWAIQDGVVHQLSRPVIDFLGNLSQESNG